MPTKSFAELLLVLRSNTPEQATLIDDLTEAGPRISRPVAAIALDLALNDLNLAEVVDATPTARLRHYRIPRSRFPMRHMQR